MRLIMMNMDKLAISLILGLSTSIAGTAAFADCSSDHPRETVTSMGNNQVASINETLYVEFTGHFLTTNGLVNRNRNIVRICPGTTVDYKVISTIGGDAVAEAPLATGPLATGPLAAIAPVVAAAPSADCGDRNSYGSLAPGDVLTCNNKNLDGRDTDRFQVKGK